jgi:hypothetical protein
VMFPASSKIVRMNRTGLSGSLMLNVGGSVWDY